MALSDDGKRVTVGGYPALAETPRLTSATVQIWDIASHTRLSEFSYKVGFRMRGLRIAPHDQFMVVAWDDAVQILNAEGSHLIQTIAAKPTAIALSGDGQYLAIAEGNGRIGVWQARQNLH